MTNNERLILTLQDRLSQHIARESELKKSMEELEWDLQKCEEEKRKSNEICVIVEEAKELLEAQVCAMHERLCHLSEDLDALPIELEKLIHGMEEGSLELDAVGGVVVWIEMVIRRSVDSLHKTIGIAEGNDEEFAIDKTGKLSALIQENEELRERLLDEEQAVAILQEREIELGTNYNALLAEYEVLQQWITQQNSSTIQKRDDCSVPDASISFTRRSSSLKDDQNPLRTDSELNNVMAQMSELQDKIGEAFGNRGCPRETKDSVDRLLEEKRNDKSPTTVRDALSKMTSSVSNAKEELEQKGAALLQNLSKLEVEEEILRKSVGELSNALSSACQSSPTISVKEDDLPPKSDKPDQTAKAVELVINITDTDQQTKDSYSALQKMRAELEDTERRLQQTNVRLLEIEALVEPNFSSKHLEWLDCRGIGHGDSLLPPAELELQAQDDLILNCTSSEANIRSKWKTEIKQTAKLLAGSRDEVSHLRDMSEFERFVLAEQQQALHLNRQETEKLIMEHRQVAQQVSSISKELAEQTKLKERQETANRQLQREKEASLKQLHEMEHETYALKKDLDTLQQGLPLMTNEHGKKQEELQKLQEMAKQSEESFCLMRNRLAEQEEDRRKTEEEYKELLGASERLSENLEQAAVEHDTLQKQKQTLKVACDNQKEELRNKVVEGKALMEEIKELSKRKTSMEYALQSLTKECTCLEEIQERKQKTLDNLEQDITQKEQERALLLRSAKRLQKTSQSTNEEARVSESPTFERSSPRHVAGVSERTKQRVLFAANTNNYAKTALAVPEEKQSITQDTRPFEKSAPYAASTTARLEAPQTQICPGDGCQGEDSSQLGNSFPDLRIAQVDPYGSASADLLIQCLEAELRKQQDRNEQQSLKITDLESRMSQMSPASHNKTSDTKNAITTVEKTPAELKNPPRDETGVLQLQVALKQALTDMDRLYERVTSITEISEEVQDSITSLHLGSPEIASSRSQSPMRSTSGQDCKSRRSTLISKTRGQIRSELLAAQKQVSNFEEKLKHIIQISAVKDRVISDLQKQLEDKPKRKEAHTFWRY